MGEESGRGWTDLGGVEASFVTDVDEGRETVAVRRGAFPFFSLR